MFDFAGLELTAHAGIIGLLHYVVIKAACCSLYFPQPALLYKPQLGDINVPGCSFREWSLGWLEKAEATMPVVKALGGAVCSFCKG